MCVPAQHCTQGLPSIPKQPTVLHEGDSLSSGISLLPKGLGGKWREGPLQESDPRLLQSLGPEQTVARGGSGARPGQHRGRGGGADRPGAGRWRRRQKDQAGGGRSGPALSESRRRLRLENRADSGGGGAEHFTTAQTPVSDLCSSHGQRSLGKTQM